MEDGGACCLLRAYLDVSSGLVAGFLSVFRPRWIRYWVRVYEAAREMQLFPDQD
jgi:hypothetical protein